MTGSSGSAGLATVLSFKGDGANGELSTGISLFSEASRSVFTSIKGAADLALSTSFSAAVALSAAAEAAGSVSLLACAA